MPPNQTAVSTDPEAVVARSDRHDRRPAVFQEESVSTLGDVGLVADSSSLGGGDRSHEAASSSGLSKTTQSSHPQRNVNDAARMAVRRELAEKETSLVWWSKRMVIVALVSAATLVAYFIHHITRHQEQQDFHSQFETYGDKLLDTSVLAAQNVFATIESMSVTITSFAEATNATWPMVTLPDYAYRGSHLLELSRALYLGLFVLVTNETRPEWEKYSVEHQGWLFEPAPGSLFRVGDGGDSNGSSDLSGQSDSGNAGADGPPTGTGTTADGPPDWVDTGSGGPPDGTDRGADASPDAIGTGGDGHSVGDFGGFGITPYITNAKDFATGQAGPAPPDTSVPDPYYSVIWQVTPAIPFMVNINALGWEYYDEAHRVMLQSNKVVLSRSTAPVPDGGTNDTKLWPFNFVIQPIRRTLDRSSPIVASFVGVILWHTYFERIVPEGTPSMVLVVKTSCDEAFSYQVDGPNVTFISAGDMHDRRYNSLGISSSFNPLSHSSGDGVCDFAVHVYPTAGFEDAYLTNDPLIYSIAIIAVFVMTSAVFIVYDCFVQKRQNTVMNSAKRTSAIVSSLFPAQFRDRIMADDVAARGDLDGGRPIDRQRLGVRGASFDEMYGHQDQARLLASRPIADLFPSVTVMFADIVGFTAWSSVREPSQVFTLLEQIYSSFDAVAKRRCVFKVETIGDCYVAAAGLPDPRRDHAVVMVRFARECQHSMAEAVNSLEKILGPDTAELTMRFGLHSGPVTAGVLRGEKTRFQLFGDTVNTAARMESTGAPSRIHTSIDTVRQLQKCGKGNWVVPREERVHVKGKGDIQTYWVSSRKAAGNMSTSASSIALESYSDSQSTELPSAAQEQKMQRLIDWNVEVLYGLLQKIVAMRDGTDLSRVVDSVPTNGPGTVLDEVEEIIELPNKALQYKQDPSTVELDPRVVDQLQGYVGSVARMYRNNSFHDFDHASHVVQSVTKLLARVVTPDSIDYDAMAYRQKEGTAKMHEYTYGIASDPLTQFACAFSALIHDVDHSGVPNAVLVKEESDLAQRYRNKSVAEQNSVDLAWELLIQPEFRCLRACIYQTEDELRRFRQLLVNSVMATDIADKDLGALRKARWEKAFAEGRSSIGSMAESVTRSTEATLREAAEAESVSVNRKATIVIEHLIQASDVSHTMQHWHVYLKWNERLFHEMYAGYLSGRLEEDPSVGWYEGELGFYDYYLIPLGKKLAACEVFGVTSDEYLNYALANRAEWERKGREIVAGYLSRYSGKRNERIQPGSQADRQADRQTDRQMECR